MRTVGLCLLALCFAAAGAYYGGRGREKARDAELLASLLLSLRDGIVYTRTELPECFSSFFKERPHPSAEDFAAGRYREALARFSLPRTLREELFSFFPALGKGEAAKEEERLAPMIKKMTEYALQTGNDIKNRRKTGLTLGVCAGAVLLLLFL